MPAPVVEEVKAAAGTLSASWIAHPKPGLAGGESGFQQDVMSPQVQISQPTLRRQLVTAGHLLREPIELPARSYMHITYRARDSNVVLFINLSLFTADPQIKTAVHWSCSTR